MKRFKKVYIEITSVCNLACSFCPPTERAAKFIKPEDFAHTLEEIKPHTDHIYLHVKGEPMLHPRLEELLQLAHDKGFKVNMTTNGTLIRKVQDKLLGHPALRQINFSLHSFDGHEGSEDKEGYLTGILSFAKEAVLRSGIVISLRLWNLDEDNSTNLQRSRNRELLGMIEQEFGLDFKIEERIERGKGIKVAERIFLNLDHEFQWPDLKAPADDGKGFCYALRSQAAVLVDGTVVPCCLDGEGVIALGNLHREAFSDIIENERSNGLYDGFSRGEAVEELCKRCGYRQRFG
ncbi:radical SAM/SPASM domain-containing protein [Gorillibacterium sp. sgz5001074]|uniref:radical SAM/SPASM domain-containing protein n=1 Tax=Gorillibacterium sp. sgz5001074 TaxID=3446695 RepID=UPI003F66DB9E